MQSRVIVVCLGRDEENGLVLYLSMDVSMGVWIYI